MDENSLKKLISSNLMLRKTESCVKNFTMDFVSIRLSTDRRTHRGTASAPMSSSLLERRSPESLKYRLSTLVARAFKTVDCQLDEISSEVESSNRKDIIVYGRQAIISRSLHARR